MNEEPQVARKGCPFLAPGGNSIRRSTDRPGRRPRLSRSYAFSTLHSIYIRGVGEGPISHGRLELRPYATGLSRVREREKEKERGRKQDLRGFGRSPRLPSRQPKPRYHGVVGDSRARERTVTERRCNKLTGSNWLSYNVTSQFAEFSGEARGVYTSNSNVRIISITDRTVTNWPTNVLLSA